MDKRRKPISAAEIESIRAETRVLTDQIKAAAVDIQIYQEDWDQKPDIWVISP